MNRRTVLTCAIAVAAAFSGLPLASPAQTDTTPRSPVAGSSAHDAAPTIRAARRSGQLRIDGRLDDPAWQVAVPFTAFRQIDPHEGQPVSEGTEALILVDADAVYIGLRLFDREPQRIRRELARRDESIDGDLVEVTIDSYHDHLTAFIFRLSPLGAKRDAAVSPSGGQDNSWDAVWDGAASVDHEGWTAEFRIPLSQLRYDPNSRDHVWGLQIGRQITRKGEPNVSLQVFAQPLLAAGDFHDYKELARPRGFDFEVYGRDAGGIVRSPDGVYTVDPDGPGSSPSFTFDERDFNSRFLRGNAVLRWEYRPGSALFLVWQQSRFGSHATGEFEAGRDFGELWKTPPVNVFVVKATYWIGR